VGKPADILFSPRTESVSTLFGSPNIFDCHRIEGLDFGLGKAVCGGLPLIVPYEGKPIRKIAVLPAGVHISRYPIESPVPNRLKGDILDIRKKPPVVFIDVRIDGSRLTAELPQHLWEESGLNVSDSVYIAIPLKWLRTLAE
jgi:hypothetical protein